MGKPKLLSTILVLVSITLLTSACGAQEGPEAPAAALEPKPTLVSVGASLEKPVPFGYDIILEEIVLRIDEVIRSNNTALTNPEGESVLEDGQEFLLIRVTNQCVKPGQEDYFTSQADYQIFDEAGNPVNAETDLTGLSELYSPSEFGSGTSKKGLLAFRVNVGENYPLLTYRQFNGSQVYLSLTY